MAFELTDEDLEFLLDLVNSDDLRDSSGLGNNIDNPTWGAADQPFIRLTAPSYVDGISQPRETVKTPRQISDILVNQDTDGDGVEENIPNQFGGNAFLTYFGQFFNHGLDFVATGASGSVNIGSAGGSDIFAPRADILEGTGDADGIPNTADDVPARHINQASTYVDLSQTYGSDEAITNLLRLWEAGDDDDPVRTAYLLTGALDETNRALLPTLNDIRENYRTMTGGDELTGADITTYQGTGDCCAVSACADSAWAAPPGGARPAIARALGTLDAADSSDGERRANCAARRERRASSRARSRGRRARGAIMVGSAVAVGARL
jgi:hypothetical protein